MDTKTARTQIIKFVRISGIKVVNKMFPEKGFQFVFDDLFG